MTLTTAVVVQRGCSSPVIPRRWRRFGAPLILAFPVACGAGDRRSSSVIVRDSAGMRIVESTAPAWTAGSRWRLSGTPIVRIGAAEDDEAHMLFQPSDGVRLPDGRIAVSDAGAHEIRFHSDGGLHIRTVGREEMGPASFDPRTT